MANEVAGNEYTDLRTGEQIQAENQQWGWGDSVGSSGTIAEESSMWETRTAPISLSGNSSVVLACDMTSNQTKTSRMRRWSRSYISWCK